jgi:hypothetical protein
MPLRVGNWSTDDGISIANSRYSAARLVPGTPIEYDRLLRCVPRTTLISRMQKLESPAGQALFHSIGQAMDRNCWPARFISVR